MPWAGYTAKSPTLKFIGMEPPRSQSGSVLERKLMMYYIFFVPLVSIRRVLHAVDGLVRRSFRPPGQEPDRQDGGTSAGGRAGRQDRPRGPHGREAPLRGEGERLVRPAGLRAESGRGDRRRGRQTVSDGHQYALCGRTKQLRGPPADGDRQTVRLPRGC